MSFLQIESARRIGPILKLESVQEKLVFFLASEGANDELGVLFILSKICVVCVPVAQWFLLCATFGKTFRFY